MAWQLLGAQAWIYLSLDLALSRKIRRLPPGKVRARAPCGSHNSGNRNVTIPQTIAEYGCAARLSRVGESCTHRWSVLSFERGSGPSSMLPAFYGCLVQMSFKGMQWSWDCSMDIVREVLGYEDLMASGAADSRAALGQLPGRMTLTKAGCSPEISIGSVVAN